MDPKDLFICHSSIDKELARRIGGDVEATDWNGRRLSVFLDEWDIGVAENIVLKINDALGKARFVAVMLSPEMVASDWCRAELSAVLYKDPSNRTARVIPLRVRDHHQETKAPIEIPALLGPLNYLDFRRKEEYARSIARLLATLRGEAPPRGRRGGGGGAGGGTIVPALPAREDPDDVPEALLSNLLSVTRSPSTLFAARSVITTKRELTKGTKYPPFILKEGRLLSFFDPSRAGSTLKEVVESAPVERVPVVDWRSDFDRWRWVVELLNETLRWHLGPLGIRFDRDRRRYYFVPFAEQRLRRQSRYVRWGSGTKRWLVRAPDEGKGGSWIHHSAELRFHDFGDRLFLSIDPLFMFTTDGLELVPGETARSLAMQWTARERNAAVLARVLLWADVLAQGRSEGSVQLDGGELTFSRLPGTAQSPVSIHERVAIRALLTFAGAEVIADGSATDTVTFAELPIAEASGMIDAI
ncbi:MAG: toll/interleukin-1 receptor domain-containing protein [Labilithrix sp.]